MSPASLHTLTGKPRAPAEPAPGLAELRRLESELESAWRRLQEAGHGAAGVRALLEDPAAEPAARNRALASADDAQQAFLALLDAFQRKLHSHFLEQVERELARAVETMTGFYGRRRIRRVLRAHRRLVRLAERYRALEPLYGTAQDHKRIAVYQRFYAGVVAFSERIRRLDPTMPESQPSLSGRIARAGRALAWRLRRLPTMLRLVSAGAGLLYTVLAKKSAGEGTPFTGRVDDFFRTLGELHGYEVHVESLAHAGTPEASDTVTFYTPTHRHGVTDNITFSHLRLPDYLVFNAVDQLPGLPRFLKERVAGTRGLIAVGGGRGSSVERALDALGEGVSRNVLIYPEGSVSEGFRGTRPPRENFGEGLVRRIRDAGYRVRLAPVSYLDNARFLDLPPRSAASEARRLRVVLSRPLEPAAVDGLLEAGGGAMLNRTLRLDWLEHLSTDETRFLGLDRVAAIESRLDLELDGIRYWGSLEPVPVGDRLEIRGDEPIRVYDEPFRGKRVRVLELPASAREADDKIVLPDLQDPDSRELLVGIRAPSHIYLAVGGTRFDGDIFRPLRVRERDYVYPGVVIRFLGLPVKSSNAIRRKLEELSGREYRTLTCANSACQVIARAANIEIDDHAEMRPFLPSHVLPTRTIRKIIEHGVRNHAGEPLEYQIYKTEDRPLEEILDHARAEELRIARAHLEAATVGAWRATASFVRRGATRVRDAVRRR